MLVATCNEGGLLLYRESLANKILARIVDDAPSLHVEYLYQERLRLNLRGEGLGRGSIPLEVVQRACLDC